VDSTTLAAAPSDNGFVSSLGGSSFPRVFRASGGEEKEEEEQPLDILILSFFLACVHSLTGDI
jgi:hypothetical protein